MVEKPLKFTVPLYPYCNMTTFSDPILAMYMTHECNYLVIIAKKRYKKDQDAPYYIGVNFDPVIGMPEGCICGFRTFESALEELSNMVDHNDVFETVFDYHKFEQTWTYFNDNRFERYWWYMRQGRKELGNEYPVFNPDTFLRPNPVAQPHPARNQPGWHGY